jgi:hypothetical protein
LFCVNQPQLLKAVHTLHTAAIAAAATTTATATATTTTTATTATNTTTKFNDAVKPHLVFLDLKFCHV